MSKWKDHEIKSALDAVKKRFENPKRRKKVWTRKEIKNAMDGVKERWTNE